MLSIAKKELIERSVLGTFILIPTVGFKLVSMLNSSHFSSEARVALFLAIFKDKEDGKQIVITELDDEPLAEAKQCFDKEHLFNLKSNIEILIEEGYINEMWRLGQELQLMVEKDKSLDAIIKHNKRTLTKISIEQSDEHTVSMIDAISNIKTGVVNHKEYKIDIPTLDKYMPVTTQSITVIGGNEGSFKTKLMIFIARKLLKNYDNISLLWYSMEDPSDKIIRGFISQDEFLTDNELRQIDYSKLIPTDVKNFDIQFVTKSSTIVEVGEDFARFRESREDRFCILIVDNLMKIIPINYKLDPDLEILREVESWNVKTSNKEASVYLLHHFTKAALDDNNKENAYQPKITHLRGSGRYKDAVTNAILVNPMYSHADLIELFEGYEDFMAKFYTITIAKNRNNEKAKIRMIAFPETNWFFEL